MPYKTPWLKDKNAGIVKIRNAVGDTTTQTGNPVSVDNEFGLGEVDSMSVALNPVQNLNGYDHPWIGGAGRNILPNDGVDETVAGVTYTNNADGSITAVGTSTGGSAVKEVSSFRPPNGNYYLTVRDADGNVGVTRGRINRYDTNDTVIDRLPDTGGSTGRLIVVDDTIGRLSFLVYTLLDGTTNTTIYPMLRDASDGSLVWTPYENICPIYPANGKNLWEYSAEEFTRYKAYAVSLPAGTYTVSAVVTSSDTDSTTCRIGFYNAGGTSISGVQIGRNSRKSVTVSLDQECASIYLYASDTANHSTGDTATWADMMIELGSVATAYVPYQSVVVQQTGINKFSFDNIASKYIYRANVQKITENSFYLGGAQGATDNMQLSVNSWAYVGLWFDFKTTEETTITVSCDVTNYLENCNGYMRIKYSDTQSGLASEQATNSPFNNVGTTHIVATATIPANKYVQIVFSPTSKGSTVTLPQFTEVTNFMLEYGDIESDFEPYQSSTYTSDLEQFVYGGTVDLVTGVLTVDRASITLTASNRSGFTAYSPNGRGYWVISDIKKDPSVSAINALLKSSNCPVNTTPISSTSSATAMALSGYTNAQGVYIVVPNLATETDFDDYMNANPTQLVYPLAEPQTIQLTPQQISLLTGINYISSSDEVTLTVTLPGWTSLIDPSKIKHDIYDLDAGNTTGRNLAGEMLRDRVAVKEKLNMEFPPMVADDYYAMLNLIKDQFFDVQYYSPFTGGKRVATMYVGDREGEPYYDYDVNDHKNNMWTNVKFNFIER